MQTVTDIDIDSMEAGPELDALVAQKVMGLWLQELSHRANKELHWVGPHPTIEGAYAYASTVIGGRLNWQSLWDNGLPRFSTDIAAAWLVIEHLRPQNWEMSLSVNHFTTEPWDCRLFLIRDRNDDAPDSRSIAHGKTAQEAICRAAYKAVLISQDVKKDVNSAD